MMSDKTGKIRIAVRRACIEALLRTLQAASALPAGRAGASGQVLWLGLAPLRGVPILRPLLRALACWQQRALAAAGACTGSFCLVGAGTERERIFKACLAYSEGIAQASKSGGKHVFICSLA